MGVMGRQKGAFVFDGKKMHFVVKERDHTNALMTLGVFVRMYRHMVHHFFCKNRQKEAEESSRGGRQWWMSKRSMINDFQTYAVLILAVRHHNRDKHLMM